jgi:hypothetical protein
MRGRRFKTRPRSRTAENYAKTKLSAYADVDAPMGSSRAPASESARDRSAALDPYADSIWALRRWSTSHSARARLPEIVSSRSTPDGPRDAERKARSPCRTGCTRARTRACSMQTFLRGCFHTLLPLRSSAWPAL